MYFGVVNSLLIVTCSETLSTPSRSRSRSSSELPISSFTASNSESLPPPTPNPPLPTLSMRLSETRSSHSETHPVLSRSSRLVLSSTADEASLFFTSVSTRSCSQTSHLPEFPTPRGKRPKREPARLATLPRPFEDLHNRSRRVPRMPATRSRPRVGISMPRDESRRDETARRKDGGARPLTSR